MVERSDGGLLGVLGRHIGIDELRLDDSGCCVLSFDEVVVNFELDEGSHRLFLYAHVGELPASPSDQLYRELLEANLLWRGTGGATLSIDKQAGDKQAGRFVLAHGIPVGHVSDVDFVTTVERFVDIAERWQRRIADVETPPVTAVEPLPTGLIHPGMFA